MSLLVLALVSACGSDADDGQAEVGEDAEPVEDVAETEVEESEEEVSDAADTSAPAEDEADGPGEPFRVGLFLPDIGPFAGIAEDQANGFRHYIEDLNGGVLSGYEVEIITADTANDPAVAQENLQRLIERDEVHAVVGVISSAVAYAVAPYIAESGVPIIFTAAAGDDLTQRQTSPNIFRTSAASSQYMLPVGTYLCEELGYETAVMVSLDYSFGWEAMGGFARAYEDAGCDVVQELYSPLGTADWGPLVQQINRDADVVVQTTTGPDAVGFLQAYRDFGLTDIPMIAHGAGTDPSSIPDPGQRELAADVQSVMYYAEAADTPANNAFQESYRSRFGETPGLYVEATFAAAMVLDAALADTTDLSPEALVEAISAVQVEDAPRGSVTFDDFGQAIIAMYLREMVDVDGELENDVVETISEEVSQFWLYDPDTYLENESYIDLTGTWAD